MRVIVYKEEGKRERVDVYLKGLLNLSREKIKEFLKVGIISINDVVSEPSYQLRNGDIIKIKGELPDYNVESVEAEEGELQVLYEDDYILVVNKSAGVITHPTTLETKGTLLNFALSHSPLAGGSFLRLGIVHRLDKETSGVIVLSKKELSYENLVTQFKNRQVYKEYLALVKGRFPSTPKEIEFTIYPDKKKYTNMKVQYLRGKKTITQASIVEYIKDKNLSLVKAVPITGRTHQIRVALSSIGFPIIGDRKYGVVSSYINRVALHSYKISFKHPLKGDKVLFKAPLPYDFRSLIQDEILRKI